MGTRDQAKEKGWEWEEDGERREITLAAMERGVREGEREGKSTREESTEQERGWEGGGPQSIDPPWRRR